MTGPTDVSTPAPGFDDVVFDSQRVFRGVLQALSFPGRIQTMAIDLDPPVALNPATAAVCLALVDLETPVWLDAKANTDPVRAYLRFHCGCSVVDDPARAKFAVIADPAAMPSLQEFDHGDDRYPDRSATVIIQVPSLISGRNMTLSGPGIDGSLDAIIEGMTELFWSEWQANASVYPSGVDVLFTCGTSLLGLPRTIRIKV